jgi:site-specific recombinase XerD
MTEASTPLAKAFQHELQELALTLRPGTVANYRFACQSFLDYLRPSFPEVRHASQLRRRPHVVGWLRSLYQRQPPLKNCTRISNIIRLRRALADIVADGRCPVGEPLFVRGDLPPQDLCLPKPLSPEDDGLLFEQLRSEDSLCSNAFLLIRMTGLRIGECRALFTDSLQYLGGTDWALRVPLGKLHNERWVPVDEQVRQAFARILELRTPADDADLPDLLLRQQNGRVPPPTTMRYKLARAAQQAGCSARVTPHRLRHTFATSMLRAGVSLLAIKEMLGHRCITMTMRYVQVSQLDLQREYQAARQKMAPLYSIPKIVAPPSGLPAIHQLIGDAKHLIEMFRRDLREPKSQRRLHRLAERLARISVELTRLGDTLK